MKHHYQDDRRRSVRFNCVGDAQISLLPSDGVVVPGKILDLSLHGIRVATTLPVNYGLRTEMVLRINNFAFRAISEVRAIRGGNGFGLEFVHLSAGGKEMLSDVIKELERVQAAAKQARSKQLRSITRETDRASLSERPSATNPFPEKSKRIISMGDNLSAKGPENNLSGISEPDEQPSRNEDRTMEKQGLVITVNLYGD